MRLRDIAASVFAVALVATTATFAQTPRSAASPGGGSGASAPAGLSQAFKTETEAKSACGDQPVVWANTSSHVLYAAGAQYYGKTEEGAYMCKNAAEKAGYHMARNGE